MREIKFRAFNKATKKMNDVISIWNGIGGEIAHVVIALDEDHEDVDTLFNNYELMQFTGLKDKNGKDIFEGDIIGIHSALYRIEFFTGQFVAFKIKEKSSQNNAYRIEWLVETYGLVVV